MPRQPFLPVYSRAGYTISPDALDIKPDQGAIIGQCIAIWSEYELQAALILGALLKANTDAAVAVFLSLRNSKTRRDALNAAADAMLKGEERRYIRCGVPVRRHS